MIWKRALAYILDSLIVLCIASLFSGIEILNPNYKEYDTLYKEYTEYTEQIVQGDIKPNEILNSEKLSDLSYDLSKLSLPITVVSLVINVIYFLGFQYLNNGQTIGKKIFKLRVVDKDNKKPSFGQMTIRSGIINSLFTSSIIIILLVMLNKSNYIKFSEYVQLIDLGLIFVSIIMILMNENKQGLHDKIAKTYVVSETLNKEK